MRCDLHVHSLHSDGALGVEETLDLAKAIGLDTIAFTDHDTVNGVTSARAYASKIGVKLISGIELSAYEETSVHILGYGIVETSPYLAYLLKEVRLKRIVRARLITERLRFLGMTIDPAGLPQENPGRAHIARALVDAGYAQDVPSAFKMFLDEGRPAFLPSGRMTAKEAAEAVRISGGLSVIAHPYGLLKQGLLDHTIVKLLPYGLAGLECDYPDYDEHQRAQLRATAAKFGLFTTGGSDFHGSYKSAHHALGAAICELPRQLERFLR